MWKRLDRIGDVVESQLCAGCGACAFLDPARYEMVDAAHSGRRPRLRPGQQEQARSEAFEVCPGVSLDPWPDSEGELAELKSAWGPVLSVWEGHAGDASLRFAGSSGGAASALAMSALDGGFHGVLHIGARPDNPLFNQSLLSTTAAEIAAHTGSRYAPASPCDSLSLVEDAPGPCVFIGKPCDVAAVHRISQRRPALAEKVGLTIAFFCAGTPGTEGTLELLRRMGIRDSESVVSLRYRGNGWPGPTHAIHRKADSSLASETLSYEEAWGDVLVNYKQWRCNLCPDHTGAYADLAVGDPWVRPVEAGAVGSSLILPRTPRGLRHLEAAIARGFLVAERVDPSLLPRSQPNLERSTAAVWGRVRALRWLGAPAPAFRGLISFASWWRTLGPMEKLRSFAGTGKRVLRKGLLRRFKVRPLELPGADDSGTGFPPS